MGGAWYWGEGGLNQHCNALGSRAGERCHLYASIGTPVLLLTSSPADAHRWPPQPMAACSCDAVSMRNSSDLLLFNIGYQSNTTTGLLSTVSFTPGILHAFPSKQMHMGVFEFSLFCLGRASSC